MIYCPCLHHHQDQNHQISVSSQPEHQDTVWPGWRNCKIGDMYCSYLLLHIDCALLQLYCSVRHHPVLLPLSLRVVLSVSHHYATEPRVLAVGHWDTNYKLLQSAVRSNHKITPVPPPHLPAADEQRNLLENDPHPPQPSLCSTLPPSPSHKYVLSLPGRGGPSHVTCVTTSHRAHLHSARDGQHHST